MKALYEKPKTFIDTPTHFCPGCGHGIVLRLIAEIIDAWGIRGKTIGLAPVGCSVLAYNYLDIDMCEAAHGRPPAVATGIKRVHPDHAFLPIRATVILRQSGRQRLFMQLTEARILPSSLSIMLYTV